MNNAAKVFLTGRVQPLAGRGEPDWRALSIAALNAEGVLCDLVDTLDNAEQLSLSDAVQRAVEGVREVRRVCDTKLHDAAERNAGTRWQAHEDHYLATYWGPALRALRGDTEAAVASLAGNLKRSPVAVAARLVKTGVWT